MEYSLKIKPIIEEYQKEAKELILNGMKERFGFIDYSLNPDLNTICKHYSNDGHAFFIGFLGSDLVCTGALTKDNYYTGRIERMSVKLALRRNGFAKIMLEHLEQYAKQMGYSKIALETNQNWNSAIAFYTNNEYKFDLQTGEQLHFVKELPDNC